MPVIDAGAKGELAPKLSFRSLTVTVLLMGSHQALADDWAPDDRTSCAAAVAAFDRKDADRIRALTAYIESVMETLDEAHTERGEPGVVASWTDGGRLQTAAMAMAHCQLHPRQTVFNASAFVYRGVRDLAVGLGVAR